MIGPYSVRRAFVRVALERVALVLAFLAIGALACLVCEWIGGAG